MTFHCNLFRNHLTLCWELNPSKQRRDRSPYPPSGPHELLGTVQGEFPNLCPVKIIISSGISSLKSIRSGIPSLKCDKPQELLDFFRWGGVVVHEYKCI